MGNEYFDHLAEELYAAVISDVLDAFGYRDRALDARVVHSAGPEVLVGRAATMLAGEQVEVEGEPYALQVEAIDALKEGEVVVATTHDSPQAAFWGELFVRLGDLAFAEPDGVVVVPSEAEEDIISAAPEKVGREDRVRQELAGGSSLAEAWARHRVP